MTSPSNSKINDSPTPNSTRALINSPTTCGLGVWTRRARRRDYRALGGNGSRLIGDSRGAGGAYVPIDPEYPAERKRYMLADSGAPVLLSNPRSLPLCPNMPLVVCLDTDWPAISQERGDNPACAVTDDNLAYVIYTSGSTGQPKGAMVHHGGVVNFLRWMQDTYKLDETDKFILKTSLNFDPSVWELFWTLWVGATVYIARPGGHLDNAYLVQLIQRTTDQHLLRPVDAASVSRRTGVELCRSLKRDLRWRSARARDDRPFYKLLPYAKLHHSYGPTETSIAATEWTCEPQTQRRIVPMGYPLANTQTCVLDQQPATRADRCDG